MSKPVTEMEKRGVEFMSATNGKSAGSQDLIQAEFHLELAHQIMRYIGRLAAEGNCKPLSALGLEPTDVDRLRRMNIPEADRLSRLSSHYLNTVDLIDRDKLMLAIDYLERERVQQETIETLIRLKATLPLMNQLYCMERETFVQQRKLLGVTDQGGRIRHLSEPEESQVYDLWTHNKQLKIPDRLILIGQQTRIPLGSVFHFLCTFDSNEFHQPM
ncbi:MAG: DUF2857 family protein [gamma proteobacterium endosymbiont of Lamellibrachia anaximandri]|nr:DUF2857 family protein [gamma proteobacterium endosymbiont of Lamellibrachia anaximandri]MBL3535142.1 DUF2857 family protein [gamma proteobacterium endosymbiont of Lamellibrachia anaximandri]